MKILYIIFVAASAVFLALSPVGFFIAFSIHDLQGDVQKREAELQMLDEKVEAQKQALQGLAERKETQEKAMDVIRKDLQEQEEALRAQQILIDKGNALSQQVGPNLLRDMTLLANKDERIRDLLANHGLNVPHP